MPKTIIGEKGEPGIPGTEGKQGQMGLTVLFYVKLILKCLNIYENYLKKLKKK